MKPENNTNADFCVCCGELVPEGRMVCLSCEMDSKSIVPSAQIKPKKKIKRPFGLLKGRKNESGT